MVFKVVFFSIANHWRSRKKCQSRKIKLRYISTHSTHSRTNKHALLISHEKKKKVKYKKRKNRRQQKIKEEKKREEVIFLLSFCNASKSTYLVLKTSLNGTWPMCFCWIQLRIHIYTHIRNQAERLIHTHIQRKREKIWK